VTRTSAISSSSKPADCGGVPNSCTAASVHSTIGVEIWIGKGSHTSCTLATLANGTMMRYLDHNDYYFSRDPSHTSGNLAAAFAVAEREGRGTHHLAVTLRIEMHIPGLISS
jgi:2-methylcitrate dehydratase PrpD